MLRSSWLNIRFQHPHYTIRYLVLFFIFHYTSCLSVVEYSENLTIYEKNLWPFTYNFASFYDCLQCCTTVNILSKLNLLTKNFFLCIFIGVVMLTVMVCCFLVFGVQKGDENVLNSSRRRWLFYHLIWKYLIMENWKYFLDLETD